MTTADTTPQEVAHALLAAPGRRVLAVDGRSGSGKTRLTARLVEELSAHGVVQVLAIEDLYDGWEGLAPGIATCAEILRRWRIGGRADWHPYDWVAMRFTEQFRSVGDGDLLIVEGCGAGASPCQPWLDALIWVTAPEDLRRIRALHRDSGLAPTWWERWQTTEDLHYRTDRTAQRADLVVDSSNTDG